MIRWFARNHIAANFLMVGILLAGIYSYFERVPTEVQPAWDLRQVEVDVEYPGGSPADVEREVVIPIEEALEGVTGVRMIESQAQTGAGEVELHLKPGVDEQETRDEVKRRVDRLRFPDEIEPPDVHIPDTAKWFDVIKVAVTGDMSQEDLLRAARRVRDDMRQMPEISQAVVQGDVRQEMAIEADIERLRDYDLGFADLVEAVRRSSVDMPAGNIRTDEGNLMVRSKGQAYDGDDFRKIVVRNENGAEVLLGQVATVRDGFEENEKWLRFNGRPALFVEALRLNEENALEIAGAVKNYVDTQTGRFPEGIELFIWDDSSEELEGRLGTLFQSMLIGSFLVIVVLGLFLRPRLAFWVILGIPVAFAGGLSVLPNFGFTLNTMSVFGFIIVVGLVVDDAIVTAEHIYHKLQEGEEPLTAAVEGAKEVAVPVTFGALTTIVAFLPLLTFDGFYGNYTRQIPPVVAAVLLFSLIETKLVLPSHLKHIKVKRKRMGPLARFQKMIADALETFVMRVYRPSLMAVTNHRYLTLAVFAAIAMVSIGFVSSGRLGFVNMPEIDRNRIIASVRMPRDTPLEVTDIQVKKIEAAVEQLKREFVDPESGESWIEDVVTSTGGWPSRSWVDSDIGFVIAAVTDPGKRSEPGPKNREIAARWTELVGAIPGARSFWISGDRGGGFRGDDDLESLEIEVRGPHSEEKVELTEEIEELLESYGGIASASSNTGRTRQEVHLSLKPAGRDLKLDQNELGRQVRSAFHGARAQEIQRGADEVRVMVRLPLDDRKSMHTLETLRIRTPDGGMPRLRDVAEIRLEKAQSRIDRIDGAQVATVSAKPVDETVNIIEIARDVQPRIDALLNPYPEYAWRFDGYVREHEETGHHIWLMGIALFFALYALLAIPFRSMSQPIVVLLAVPFGVIGALAGHLILDVTPSYLSVFGMLALAGVVVNDSLVMVDFTNRRRLEGQDSFTAVVDSGARRFRPIILTSLTTFMGLLPLMLDPSLQAQMLIPMAVSLGFGILFATVITLYLIPSGYLVMEDVLAFLRRAFRWYARPFERGGEDEEKESQAVAKTRG